VSAADISVTWYADYRRATVDDADGRKWWLAPNAAGGYDAMCDDPLEVRAAGSMDDAMVVVLGEQAEPYLGVAR
jgi:hypothetical protein